MTVDDALRRGRECETAGDAAGAEAAYREADNLGDPEGAVLLGVTLKRRGDTTGALEAFQRAEARGHREAGSSLGNLLSEIGDFDGARAAYERSIAAGSGDAVLNLGLTLAQGGEVDEALRYLRLAQGKATKLLPGGSASCLRAARTGRGQQRRTAAALTTATHKLRTALVPS